MASEEIMHPTGTNSSKLMFNEWWLTYDAGIVVHDKETLRFFFPLDLSLLNIFYGLYGKRQNCSSDANKKQDQNMQVGKLLGYSSGLVGSPCQEQILYPSIGRNSLAWETAKNRRRTQSSTSTSRRRLPPETQRNQRDRRPRRAGHWWNDALINKIYPWNH